MTASGAMTEQMDVVCHSPHELAGKMGYTITCEKGQMKVRHQQRGDRVKIANGCQISRVVALQIIGEADVGLKGMQMSREEWLTELVNALRFVDFPIQ